MTGAPTTGSAVPSVSRNRRKAKGQIRTALRGEPQRKVAIEITEELIRFSRIRGRVVPHRIPDGTRLLSLRIVGEQVTIDLSREFLPVTKDAERLDGILELLVEALAEDLPQLRHFFLRIEGPEGTIRPLDDYLKKPARVDGKQNHGVPDRR
jgi:hypothetical protein